MTQVAGLQTVDAEGNVIGTLSVDDLTELVANNLVKSTQNQIAAARSVSTMSEASTLAASDDYENTLPIDANPASVRTLDADGNPKQTPSSAFAQVVGGLMSKDVCLSIYNKAVTPISLYDNVNLDDFKESANVFVRENCSNTPNTYVWWYVEIIKFVDGRYVIQRATSPDTNPSQVFVRCCLDGVWKTWVKLV